MICLKVTFRVDAHQIAEYKGIFGTEFLPILKEHGFRALGIFETLIGDAGEFTELWEFDDISTYYSRWKALCGDPRVRDILNRTGPLVHDEKFALMESVNW